MEVYQYKGNNIYFEIVNSNEATIVHGNCDQTGALYIPSQVEDSNGNVYTVTSIQGNEGNNWGRSGAFLNNTNITEVHIPGTVKYIGINSFAGCNHLSVIDIAEGVEVIYPWAFKNIINVDVLHKTVNIPSTVKQMYQDGEETWGSAFDQTDGTYLGDNRIMLDVTMASPTQAKTIPSRTFWGFGTFGDFVIPEGIETIGTSAFAGCSFNSITFPSTLKSMNGIFDNNGGLYGTNDVTFNSDAPSATDNDIAQLSQHVAGKIYVPAQYYDNYANDPQWSKIINKIEKKTMTEQGVKFFSKAYGAEAALAKSTELAGSIVFDKTSKTIFVGGVQYGGGNVKDASFANNVLNIWKDGDAEETPSISLDFSSLATTSSVMAVFQEIADQILLTETAGEYIAEEDADYISEETLKALNEDNVITVPAEGVDGDTAQSAIAKLDNKGKLIVNEMIANEKVVATAFGAIRDASGLEEDFTYKPDASSNYITGASSLTDADSKLDAAIKAVDNKIAEAGKVDDVKVNGETVVVNKIANISVDGTYNSNSNKIATETTVSDAISGLTGSATIASESNGVVTLKTGVAETDGIISNATGTDIVLKKVATTGKAEDITIDDTEGKITATTVEGALTELATAIEESGLTLADDEKILDINDKKLSSTLTIDIQKQGEGDEAKEYIILKGKEGAEVSKVDASAFVKDGMIDSVAWKKDAEEHDTNVLVITWNTDAGKTATEVDMSKFIDTYTSGDETALTVEGYVITPNTGEVAEDAGTLTTGGQVYTAIAATKGQDIQTITGETATTNDSNVEVKVTATKGQDDDNYTLSTTAHLNMATVADGAITTDGVATAQNAADIADAKISALAGDVTSDDASIATVEVKTVGGEVNDVIVTTTSAGVAYVPATETAEADLTVTTATGAVTGTDITAIKSYVDAHSVEVEDKAATINTNATDATTIATVGGTNITAKVALLWEEWE